VTQPVFDLMLLEISCGGSNTAASPSSPESGRW